MTTYKSRSSWTSTRAAGAVLASGPILGVSVHWPGTTTSAYGVESETAIANRLRSWRDWHIRGRGWSDIGYNVAIDQAGRVWMLRSTSWAGNRSGAHSASASNPGANRQYVGVLLILGANEQPSAAMVEAFRDWRHRHFLPGHGSSKTAISGHGQIRGAQTSCPGSRVRTLISNGSLARRPGGSTPNPPKPPDPPQQEDDMPPYRDWPAADKKELVDDLVAGLMGHRIDRFNGKNKVRIDTILGWIYRDGHMLRTGLVSRLLNARLRRHNGAPVRLETILAWIYRDGRDDPALVVENPDGGKNSRPVAMSAIWRLVAKKDASRSASVAFAAASASPAADVEDDASDDVSDDADGDAEYSEGDA